jgi:hypothetical protein
MVVDELGAVTAWHMGNIISTSEIQITGSGWF